jgi:hypothetical protein
MKYLLIVLAVFAFTLTSCSQTPPCSLKEGLTVEGCKEKGKDAFGKVKEGWNDLKERVED